MNGKTGNWVMIDHTYDPSEIIINDGTGDSQPIVQKPTSKATKSLGIMFTPKGDMKPELEYLIQIG
jgi:hypothetical protein